MEPLVFGHDAGGRRGIRDKREKGPDPSSGRTAVVYAYTETSGRMMYKSTVLDVRCGMRSREIEECED